MRYCDNPNCPRHVDMELPEIVVSKKPSRQESTTNRHMQSRTHGGNHDCFTKGWQPRLDQESFTEVGDAGNKTVYSGKLAHIPHFEAVHRCLYTHCSRAVGTRQPSSVREQTPGPAPHVLRVRDRKSVRKTPFVHPIVLAACEAG